MRLRERLAPLVLLLPLLSSLPGCSGYRAATIPGVEYAGALEENTVDLFVGQSARITLKSGKEEVGEIVGISDSEITLGRPSNFGFLRIAIPVAEIGSVEVEHVGRVESIIGWTVFGVGVLTAAFLIMMRNAFSGMGA